MDKIKDLAKQVNEEYMDEENELQLTVKSLMVSGE